MLTGQIPSRSQVGRDGLVSVGCLAFTYIVALILWCVRANNKLSVAGGLNIGRLGS